VSSDDPAERARAFEILVRAYFRPVYAHVRIKWKRDAEDARDLTQGFFARAFEKRSFGAYDRARARFRTYLKGSLDHFVMEEARDQARQKRGGGALKMSLDFDVAEGELTSAIAPADSFDHEWTRSLFSAAVAALEASCERQGKKTYFDVFRAYVLDPEDDGRRPTYAEVAAAHAISATDVTNYLSWTRREMRSKVLEQLREITADEEEMREEARALGFEP
jgi:DNA-directed RNA polymerase specialized sigma24 family protein